MMKNKIETHKLSLWYGKFQALNEISLAITENAITAIIGPSGCGKSTYLRALNRMNEELGSCTTKGEIFLDEKNLYNLSVTTLRKRVGMVFQRPNPFPSTIYENIVFGPLIHHMANNRQELLEIVYSCLEDVGLNELKERLDQNALKLSLEQQQRLCIARAIATRPEVLLLDEPCSALDPQATLKIEDLITNLKSQLTIVIVTHNMHQAGRVSDKTAFFHLGNLVECGNTHELFSNPKQKLTENYISGNFG